MKKITLILLLLSGTIFGQIKKDSVVIHDKDYTAVKTVPLYKVFKTVDSLYNTNNEFYDSFYVIGKKDTLFIRRAKTFIRTKKIKNGRTI